jgi:hypothetical protein
MTDLLEAVWALTRPTHRKVIVDNPAGPLPTKVVTVTDEALLEQIDNAIRSNMGGSTPGGSDPRTRSILNIGAFNVVQAIADKVHMWARMAGSVIDKESLPKTLEAWHAKFIAHPWDINDAVHTKIMRGWAAQIQATLAPPREKDLPDPCPACGASEWWRDGERFFRPLIIRYKPDDPAMVDRAVGMCRACAETWGVRELQFELEKAQINQ